MPIISTAILGPPLTAPEPAAAAAGPPLDAAQQQLDRPGLPAGGAPAAAARLLLLEAEVAGRVQARHRARDLQQHLQLLGLLKFPL